MSKKTTEPENMAAETAAAVPTETTNSNNEKPRKRIYAGASIPGMKQNTVFEGDIPKVLNVPFVRDLCMELSEYGKFVKDKLDSNSRAAYCYNKSVELAKKLIAEKN